MKTVFAVFVAIILMLVGWVFLAILLYGIGYLAFRAREGLDLAFFLHIFLVNNILSPGYGGFLATYVTPQIIRGVSVLILTTSFVSVVVTWVVIMGSLDMLTVKGELNIGDVIRLVVQCLAIFVGAKLGNIAHTIKSR